MNMSHVILSAGVRVALRTPQKTDYELGYLAGKQNGYAEGTCKLIGDDWLPSVGHGLCQGLYLATVALVLRLLWNFRVELVLYAGRLCVELRKAFEIWWLRRTLDFRLQRQRQSELAEADARARILAAGMLREANATLDDEQVRLDIERFMRQTRVVPEMQARIEIGLTACESALDFIAQSRLLTNTQKQDLLRHLAGVFPGGAPAAA